MHTSIKLRIALNDTNPEIWRSIVVPNTITFFDLHHVFQIAMGWTNSHLFELTVNDYTIGYFDPQFEGSESTTPAEDVTLDLLLTKENMQFKYLYDLGDHWEHTVTVEGFIHPEHAQIFPVCTNGILNCPPEDCGGIHGFYQMLKILKDKKNPEYREVKTWVGRGYSPEKINLEKINKELRRFKKYMKHWED